MARQNWIRPKVATVEATATVGGHMLIDSAHYLMALTGLAILLVTVGTTATFAQGHSQVPSRAADTAPSFDVRSICNHAIDPTVETSSGCAIDESAARGELVKTWTQYPSRERENCVSSVTELPSYVELLTCLQMARDVANERVGQDASKPTVPSLSIPEESSAYIPPSLPSGSDASTITPPVVQPYNPPPITTFSDRVNNAIQSYPLQRGIGNNPTNMQSYIRQNSN
jgi:hypothetical protein